MSTTTILKYFFFHSVTLPAGMEHDTNQCKCPDDHCIMAPSSSTVAPVHWSSCSKDYLALAFEHGMDYCLRNKPTSLFSSPVCGNGFVEPGEQCDCGLPDYCDNTCCNPNTCTLYENATCATGECCDLTVSDESERICLRWMLRFIWMSTIFWCFAVKFVFNFVVVADLSTESCRNGLQRNWSRMWSAGVLYRSIGILPKWCVQNGYGSMWWWKGK